MSIFQVKDQTPSKVNETIKADTKPTQAQLQKEYPGATGHISCTEVKPTRTIDTKS